MRLIVDPCEHQQMSGTEKKKESARVFRRTIYDLKLPEYMFLRSLRSFSSYCMMTEKYG